MASTENQESAAKLPQLQVASMLTELRTENKKLQSSLDEQDGPVDTPENKNKIADKTNNVKNVEKVVNCNNTKDDNDEEVILVEHDDEVSEKKISKTPDAHKAENTDTIPENDVNVNNSENLKDSAVKGGSTVKRKRRTLASQETDSPAEDVNLRTKRKKTKNTSDKFCWRCHKESVEAQCSACPRSWHRKCIGMQSNPGSTIQNWICAECAAILRAENAETRSTAMEQLSVDQLCLLLRHVVERMRDYPGSEPFWKPVDLSEVPNYLDYVIKPMDLSLLESNVRAKLYGSTDAFMADAKWIQHNCIVFNTCGGVYTDTSKLTNAAKQIIKLARQEVSEIDACPDCYAHGRNLPRPQPAWFIEPCRRPHPLVWAKLKGFPFWPAKAMPRINSQGFVDVRFFGEHDRAWVSPRDLYLYSEDPPVPLPRKRKLDMDECVQEITRHCRKLELVFGQFKFAPPKVQYNPNDPTQIKLMLPSYDPLSPNNCVSPQFLAPKKRPAPKKRAVVKSKSQSDSEKSENSDSGSKTLTDCDTSTEKEQRKNDDTSLKMKETEILDGIEFISITCGDSKELQKVENKERPMSGKRTVMDTKVAKDENIKPGPSRIITNDKRTIEPKVNKTEETKGKGKEVLNDSRKSLDEIKISENLSKQTTSSVANAVDHQILKKDLVLNSNAVKGDSPHHSTNVQKSVLKTTKPAVVYKPKTRMVDKVNAEKALKSISASGQNQNLKTNEEEATAKISNFSVQSEATPSKETVKHTDNNVMSRSVSVSSNKPQTESSDIQGSAKNSADQSLALVLVVNNNASDSPKQPSSMADKGKGSDIPIIQQMPKNTLQTSNQKKESKARKTFPNKPRNCPQGISHIPPNVTSNSVDSMVYIPTQQGENGIGYQLLPPEAGPISTRLYHGAQDLVRRMAQLMEEAYKEAAQNNQNCENGTSENHQATVHFLRLQMERMRWQHQQQLAELKHNTDRILREMKSSLEAERLRAIEETRREAEEEKLRYIEEIKRKQWCAMCGREALFYCCWNTAYCDYPCQQSHWPLHMRTCAQKPSFTTIVTSSAANSNQQQNHKAKVNSPAGRVCKLSKLSEISTSLSLSYSRNDGNQESS